MTQASSIEWTDATWNATRGCSMARGSETGGCLNCYAARMAARFPWGKGFARMTENGPRWTGRVELVPTALDWPLRYKGHPLAKAEGRPTRIFVNSTSDLFHESLSNEDIAQVFHVMYGEASASPAHDHVYQILTKRAERMRAWFEWLRTYEDQGGDDATLVALSVYLRMQGPNRRVWLGVSVEDQKTADSRIPLLLQTPAAVRFVSYEPALGPVDLGLSAMTCSCCRWPAHRWIRVLEDVRSDFADLMPETARHLGPGTYRAESNPHGALFVGGLGIKPDEFERLPGLDWVIAGGESGPGARPFDIAWARSAVAQCKAAGVAVFVKQLGARPYRSRQRDDGKVVEAWDERLRLLDRKGGDMGEWPEDLRVRQFPKGAA